MKIMSQCAQVTPASQATLKTRTTPHTDGRLTAHSTLRQGETRHTMKGGFPFWLVTTKITVFGKESDSEPRLNICYC
jgi:hypothetical protein